MHSPRTMTLLLLLGGLPALAAQQVGRSVARGSSVVVELFERGSVEIDGRSYGYRLLEPLPTKRDRELPLVVFLHGSGERGSDNEKQLTYLPQQLATPARREKYPCFVLAVQCPADEKWSEVPWDEATPRAFPRTPSGAMRAVQKAMAAVVQRPGVDRARVYLTGISMGGFGTWDLMARETERFACAVPICGGGDPDAVAAMLDLPVDVWHGGSDDLVPPIRSRLMAERYRQLGAPVRYHEPAELGHDVWQHAYQDERVLDWMFAQDQRQQRRGAWSELAVVPPLRQIAREPFVFRLQKGARCVVPDDVRATCSYFLDALALPTMMRPGMVTAVEPRAGDIALQIDAELTAQFRLEVADTVRIVARDRDAMRAGLAAFYCAMRTHRDGAVPRGQYEQVERVGIDRLIISQPQDGGVGPSSWQRGELQELLRECWLSSVQTLTFEGGLAAHMREPLAEELAERAAGLAVAIDDATRFSGTPTAVTGDDLATVLAAEVKSGELVVRLRPATAANLLLEARRLLPVVMEAAARGDRIVPLASFLPRLAARF